MTGLLYCQIYSIQTNVMAGDCMRGRFDEEEKWAVWRIDEGVKERVE